MKRKTFVLGALAESKPSYDELCRAVIEAFPGDPEKVNSPRSMISCTARCHAQVKAVRAVRIVLWDELAVIESDETLWLTRPDGRRSGSLPSLAHLLREVFGERTQHAGSEGRAAEGRGPP